MSEKPCGAYFFAFFEKFVAPILTSGGFAAVSSSAFAALYSAFGKYDVVHIHAEGPAFFAWLPKMFGKRVVVTVHGIDWQREKWQARPELVKYNAFPLSELTEVFSALERQEEKLSAEKAEIVKQRVALYEQYADGNMSKEEFIRQRDAYRVQEGEKME